MSKPPGPPPRAIQLTSSASNSLFSCSSSASSSIDLALARTPGASHRSRRRAARRRGAALAGDLLEALGEAVPLLAASALRLLKVEPGGKPTATAPSSSSADRPGTLEQRGQTPPAWRSWSSTAGQTRGELLEVDGAPPAGPAASGLLRSSAAAPRARLQLPSGALRSRRIGGRPTARRGAGSGRSFSLGIRLGAAGLLVR